LEIEVDEKKIEELKSNPAGYVKAILEFLLPVKVRVEKKGD